MADLSRPNWVLSFVSFTTWVLSRTRLQSSVMAVAFYLRSRYGCNTVFDKHGAMWTSSGISPLPSEGSPAEFEFQYPPPWTSWLEEIVLQAASTASQQCYQYTPLTIVEVYEESTENAVSITLRKELEESEDGKAHFQEELEDVKIPFEEEPEDTKAPFQEESEDVKFPFEEEPEDTKIPFEEELEDVKVPFEDETEDVNAPPQSDNVKLCNGWMTFRTWFQDQDCFKDYNTLQSDISKLARFCYEDHQTSHIWGNIGRNWTYGRRAGVIDPEVTPFNEFILEELRKYGVDWSAEKILRERGLIQEIDGTYIKTC
ncbi:hypothetical protein EDC01DRAFT_625797 [Geopyxis carbonaria]|nr:hypothetical protein EDC01DRAFT_625797 [Geopyxis carbonaria]